MVMRALSQKLRAVMTAMMDEAAEMANAELNSVLVSSSLSIASISGCCKPKAKYS